MKKRWKEKRRFDKKWLEKWIKQHQIREVRREDLMKWDEVTKRVQINIYNEVVKVNKKWIIK